MFINAILTLCAILMSTVPMTVTPSCSPPPPTSPPSAANSVWWSLAAPNDTQVRQTDLFACVWGWMAAAPLSHTRVPHFPTLHCMYSNSSCETADTPGKCRSASCPTRRYHGLKYTIGTSKFLAHMHSCFGGQTGCPTPSFGTGTAGGMQGTSICGVGEGRVQGRG